MNLKAQIRAIEKRMEQKQMDMKIHFFNHHDEYMEAYNKNQISKKDISFIDDIRGVD